MKRMFNPLHLLIALSLLLAFAWPAAAADSVSDDVYGPVVEEPIVPVDILMEVEPGNRELKVMFVGIKAAEYYEIVVTEADSKKSVATKTVSASVNHTTTDTFKNLKNNYNYSVTVTAYTGANVVGSATRSGTPVRGKPTAMPGLNITAGDGKITITFNKLKVETPDTYQIHWWTEIDKKTGYPKYKPIVINAKDVKANSYTYTFIGAKNGTTYNFNVFAQIGDRDIVALTTNQKATPKAAPNKKGKR